MSALSLTIVTSLAAVRVSVTGAAPNAAVTVTRSDVNGTANVRQPLGLITDGNGEVQMLDYEPALTGTLLYSMTGAASKSTDAPDVVNPVVHSVAYPDVRASSALLAWSSSRAGMSQVNTVLNRRDPLVVLRPLALRTGTGTLSAVDYGDAAALVDVLDRPPVMLRTPCFAGLDVFAVITSVDVSPAQRVKGVRRWTVAFNYTEMSARDVRLIDEAAWTIGAADDAFDTIAEAGVVFATLRDYAIGPAS